MHAVLQGNCRPAERNGMIIGIVAAVLLIGACVFLRRSRLPGRCAPSRPFHGELAKGNFGVVLPDLAARDEIGDVAGAVEKFKVVAEKRLATRRSQDQAGSDRGATAQGGHDQAGRRFRRRGRRDHRNRVVGFDRTRSVSRNADQDRRAGAGSDHDGRGRVGRGFHQRAVGGVGDRGADVVGQRDQPPGAGIGADGQRGGRSGAQDQRSRRRVVEGGRPDRRRGRIDQYHRRARPICWR